MKVTIRPLEEKDAYISYKWRNDKEVFSKTLAVYDREISLEMEIEWIKKVISITSDYRCAIDADRQYVGNIYLTNINDRNAEYHIFIGDKKYWGKGVAREASIQILKYAFGDLKLSKVYLKVRQDNVKAIKLYDNLGFSKVSEYLGVDTMELRSNEFNYFT